MKPKKSGWPSNERACGRPAERRLRRDCRAGAATAVLICGLILPPFMTPDLAQADEVDCEAADTQTALTICADREAKAADEALTRAYDALSSAVSDASRSKLEAAQQSFVAYRAAQCEFNAAGTEGGSIHPMVIAQCIKTLTDFQIDVLRAQSNCQEGDFSCGGQ